MPSSSKIFLKKSPDSPCDSQTNYSSDNDDSMEHHNFALESCSSSDCSDKTHSATEDSDLKLTGTNKILFSGDIFKIVEKREKTAYEKKMRGIIALCQVCSKKIKGSLGVSSNFLSHMRKNHPEQYNVFKIKKQGNKKKSEVTQGTFSRDLLNFICETASPLSIIENESFKKLFPGKIIPCRRSITQLLMDSHEGQVKRLRNDLNNVKYVCTTADVWSGGRKYFLGYTCHWLDSNTFKMKSAALACRRFKATHSFDRITDIICDINCFYELPFSKIVCTITDNGSNLAKELKQLGVSMKLKDEYDHDSNEDSDEGEDSFSQSSVLEFRTVTPRISKHFRCASHTLNLLATTDFTNIINSSSEETKNLHKLSFNRCTNIWKKCGRTKSAQVIKAVLSSQLITPCCTRWNSLYDSVKKLMQYKSRLGELCYKLEVATFLQDEIKYLEEYLKIMQPIADGIDFLQAEKNILFGYFLPALLTIKVKMRRLETENFEFLGDINVQMQSALIKRFEKYFLVQTESIDAVIASVLIPDVKLRFLKTLMETAENCSEEFIKEILNQYGLEFVKEYGRISTEPSTSEKSFLDFGYNSNDGNVRDNPELACISREACAYLADRETNISSLHRYPMIRCLFLKYNTPLPSSAPVESLFSFCGIINHSRRQKLTDNNFEMFVLKKANKL